MPIDALDHMEEAWNLDDNPFPAEAIHIENTPYCPTVFEEESQEFRRKLIRGSVGGSVNVGFLWSQGKQADTGFGKTTLMREITKEINRDLGIDTLAKAGVRPEKRALIAAAYSNLNNLNASGLYPVLFNAVLDLAAEDRAESASDSVLDQVRARIVQDLGTDDVTQIARHVTDTWLRICGTAPPLRPEVVSDFASGGARGVRDALGTVSATARLRNGLHYLDFALAALSAAGVDPSLPHDRPAGGSRNHTHNYGGQAVARGRTHSGHAGGISLRKQGPLHPHVPQPRSAGSRAVLGREPTSALRDLAKQHRIRCRSAWTQGRCTSFRSSARVLGGAAGRTGRGRPPSFRARRGHCTQRGFRRPGRVFC